MPRLAVANQRFAAAYLRRGLKAVGQATVGVAVAGELAPPSTSLSKLFDKLRARISPCPARIFTLFSACAF